MVFPAHIKEDGRTFQTVPMHCSGTAAAAADDLSSVGLGKAAEAGGMLHDIGKERIAYRDYLNSEEKVRGSVTHTFQACRLLLERYHGEEPNSFEAVTAELLAYACGAHHGLFDLIGSDGRSGFLHRLKAENTAYEEVLANYLADFGGWDATDALFKAAHAELMPIYERITALAGNHAEDLSFYIGFLARLLLSAVIDGDRRDTASFMNDTVFPKESEDMRPLWRERLAFLEDKLSHFSCSSAINRARADISAKCHEAAGHEPGMYRLNVPTGAGKTLSSLRFALAHASHWNKRRIVFTAPLLTILDQNAEVIRAHIGDDSLILEHHSNLIREETDTANREDLNRRDLLTENWSSPVIITTLVQLLDTLFSGKTSCIRRFQALCDSIIIIDEVQTVPNRMLSLFNLALGFLVRVCGATVVLCSATQPALDAADRPLPCSAEDIVPYSELLWAPFKRTRICGLPATPLSEIPALIMDCLNEANSVLVVCNKKAEAARLFDMLRGGPYECYHLSASMCMAHRKATLRQMMSALEGSRNGGRAVMCISTQVIEAGVDISFERVIRLAAGMDSVVQSAGRCNRNGESDVPAPVYLLPCADESLSHLRDIKEGRDATLDLLAVYRRDPERFGADLASDAAIRYYYRRLYGQMPKGYQDYAVKDLTLFDLLSLNTRYADEDCEGGELFFMKQAFKLAGSLFEVFDDNSADVAVPYGAGAELIDQLFAFERPPEIGVMRQWLEKAKPYSVSLMQYQLDALIRSGGVIEHHGVFILQPEHYDDCVGVKSAGSLGLLEV